MHAEAQNYLISIRNRFKDISGLKVLEFGSHDVNGSPRDIFSGCAQYIGIDEWPGKGVDVVGRAQDYKPDELFDIVITAEAMEHDPDPAGQVRAAWQCLKPGGIFIMTAAAPPRAAHLCSGMIGTKPEEHYKNIEPAEVARWLSFWAYCEITYNKPHGDIYAMAVRP